MPNYLKMPKKSLVLALLELGWSYRRIQAETGVRRETVSGYSAARQANPAKTFPGSDPSPPADSPDLSVHGDSNPAKTFVGSESKPATTFPGSVPRRRFAAALYGAAIARETRRRSDCATHLAGRIRPTNPVAKARRRPTLAGGASVRQTGSEDGGRCRASRAA